MLALDLQLLKLYGEDVKIDILVSAGLPAHFMMQQQQQLVPVSTRACCLQAGCLMAARIDCQPPLASCELE